MGYVEGGAETVIQAFLDCVGQDGTLVFPTLIQKNFKQAYETWYLDKPSDVGYITEVFRKRSDALRSDQATHSVAAMGKHAKMITEGHCAYGPRVGLFGDYAFAYSSPWEKMYHLNVKMVFIGVPMKKGTMRHLAEYKIVEKILKEHPEIEKDVQRFGQERYSGFWVYIDGDKMQEEFTKMGILKRALCGNAEILCVNAEPFVDQMIQLSEQDPDYYTTITNRPLFL